MSNLHLESCCPGGKRRDHKVARCSHPGQFLVALDHLGERLRQSREMRGMAPSSGTDCLRNSGCFAIEASQDY